MLPLAGDRSPTSADEFSSALRTGLSKHGVVASVVADGEWPKLRSLRIDLAQSNGSRPLPKLHADESLAIEAVTIIGHPVRVEGVPAELDVQFTSLRAGIAPDGVKGWQVVPLGAQSGHIVLEADRNELEKALHQVISEQAGKHGATVKSTRLELSAPNPRAIVFAVVCTAKMFIATTTLTIRGLAEIDENLDAKLSSLSVSGEGMMGTMAQGFLQPHVEQWNGRVMSLASYVAGGLALRDVQISVGATVRVEASLGART